MDNVDLMELGGIFSRYFSWQCKCCGNLNTFDPAALEENAVVVSFDSKSKQVLADIRCHFCWVLFEIDLSKDPLKFIVKCNSDSVCELHTLYSSEQVGYSYSVNQAMEAANILEDVPIIKAPYQYTMTEAEYVTSVSFSNAQPYFEVDNSVLLDFCKIRVRNIYEYYAVLEVITMYNLPYEIDEQELVLPAMFDLYDFLICIEFIKGVLHVIPRRIMFETFTHEASLPYTTIIDYPSIFRLLLKKLLAESK